MSRRRKESISYQDAINVHSNLFNYKKLNSSQLTSLSELEKAESTGKIRKILLISQNLTKIPPILSLYKNITSLDLSQNSIDFLDVSITLLTRLKTLCLQNNNIREMPEGIEKMRSLEEIYLCHNSFTIFPPLHKLPNLVILDLSDNHLSSLPDQFDFKIEDQEKDDQTSNEDNQPSLIIISNESEVVPKRTAFRYLEEIYLNRNRIEGKIPTEFLKAMPNIVVFDISNNIISEINDVFGDLKNLRDLNFSNNAITKIPLSFISLENLEILDVSKNQMVMPPTLICQSAGPSGIRSYLEQYQKSISVKASLSPNSLQVENIKSLSLQRKTLSRQNAFFVDVNNNSSNSLSVAHLNTTLDYNDFIYSLFTNESSGNLYEKKAVTKKQEQKIEKIRKEILGISVDKYESDSDEEDDTSKLHNNNNNENNNNSVSNINDKPISIDNSSCNEGNQIEESRNSKFFEMIEFDTNFEYENYYENHIAPLQTQHTKNYISALNIHELEFSSSFELKQQSNSAASQLFLVEVDQFTPHYLTRFCQSRHVNYVGIDKKRNPIIVSMQKDTVTISHNGVNEEFYEILVWSPQKTQLIREKLETVVRDSGKNTKKVGKLTPRQVFSYFTQSIPILHLSVLRPIPSNDKSLLSSLIDLEKKLGAFSKGYKFGILNIKNNQKLEDDIYSNKEISPEFDEFLQTIGDKIELKNLNFQSGFKAGLDTQYGHTGNHTIIAEYGSENETIPIIFHVAAYLPHSDINLQQLEKKRHIGNDVVIIVFAEGNAKFRPSVISSEFNHVFVVVRAEGTQKKRSYRLEIVCKSGVPINVPPLITDPPVCDKSLYFKRFFLTKLINLERMAYHAPMFEGKIQRTRKALLTNFIEELPAKKVLPFL